MRLTILVPIGAGAALVLYGLTRGTPELKALKKLGSAPVDKNEIPQHTKDQDVSQATYCQLLTAYRQDLAVALTTRDDAKVRLGAIEKQATSLCDDYSWNATWNYQYGAFAGKTVWKKWQSESRKIACLDYVRGQVKAYGKPDIKNPPSKGADIWDGSWAAIAQNIRALQKRVADAKVPLPGLREKYQKTKKELATASAKAAELEKKIRDLEVQEVDC